MSAVYAYIKKHSPITENTIPLIRWNQMYGTVDNHISEDVFMLGSNSRSSKSTEFSSNGIVHVGEYLAVADAVLYNREELVFVPDNGIPTERLSDEEFLIRYVLENGFDALKNVNGDFSGIVYHIPTKEVTVFRDHMGVRPLFYYNDEETLVFSTDIRGIASLSDIDLSPNEEYLYLYSMGYNELTLCCTAFEKIFCVQPASWTTFYPFSPDLKKPEFHTYWRLGTTTIRMKNDQEYITRLRELITDSIARRARVAGIPVGCELSGGLDSGVIGILLHRLGYQGVYYSWSLSEEDLPLNPEADERQVIHDICSAENIKCAFPKKLTAEEQDKAAEIYLNINIPYLNTQELNRGSSWMHNQGAVAVLSGHGGDEGVSHRCNLYELWYHKEYLWYFRVLWRGTKGIKLRFPCMLYRFFRQITQEWPNLRREFRSSRGMQPYMKPTFLEKMKSVKHPRLPFAYDPVEYTMQGGPRVRLDNAAVQGAEAGVQYMFPYLDYRVFDYAVSIPRHLYQNGRGNRWIYREAFRDIMPESLRSVRYKDTASMRHYKADAEEIKDCSIRIKDNLRVMIRKLDRAPWNEYYDFGTIGKWLEKDQLNVAEIEAVSNIMNVLLVCLAIQNIKDQK